MVKKIYLVYFELVSLANFKLWMDSLDKNVPDFVMQFCSVFSAF